MKKILSTLFLFCTGVLFAEGTIGAGTSRMDYRIVIASLAGVVAVLYGQGVRERAKHTGSELAMAKMLGELNQLLRKIPKDLKNHEDLALALAKEFRCCMAGCEKIQGKMETVTDILKK